MTSLSQCYLFVSVLLIIIFYLFFNVIHELIHASESTTDHYLIITIFNNILMTDQELLNFNKSLIILTSKHSLHVSHHAP